MGGMLTQYVKATRTDKTSTFAGHVTITGNTTVFGNFTVNGNFTFGNAVMDALVLNGRMSTSTVAGAALDLGATYTYGELFELRADVSSWTGIAGNFTGAYLRFSTSSKTTSYNLRGMELNVASTTSVVNLSGLYSETQCKALAAGSTWTSVRGVEANLSFYDQTQTVAVTEAGCIYGTIGLGSGYTAYTGIHGLVIETRDGSVGTRTIGSGIVLRNITPAEGTQTFTKGLQVAMACTTGISLEGTMTTGIAISGTATNALVFSAIGAGTDGSLIKAGTSGSNLSAGTTANANYMQFYITSAATTGTTRGIYDRLYLTAGAGGEALRAFTTVSNNAPADTVNGAHISLSFGASAGNVTGLGTASRHTLHLPNRSLGGTTTVIQSEMYTDGESAAFGGVTSFFRCVSDGTGSTGKDTIDSNAFFLDLYGSGLTGASGKFYDTSKTTGTHTGGLRVKLPDGSTGWVAIISA